ncbi:hypothetical protein HMI54_003345 [Coelomomyces lativittatus]|nr:hypothetical protein HMI54_003345 [Coelomomyces lativittatus]
MTSSCFFSSSSSSSSLNLSGMEENECMDYEILEDYLSDPHPDLFKKVYQSSFPDGLSFKKRNESFFEIKINKENSSMASYGSIIFIHRPDPHYSHFDVELTFVHRGTTMCDVV